jgi:hypothetical protein
MFSDTLVNGGGDVDMHDSTHDGEANFQIEYVSMEDNILAPGRVIIIE